MAGRVRLLKDAEYVGFAGDAHEATDAILSYAEELLAQRGYFERLGARAANVGAVQLRVQSLDAFLEAPLAQQKIAFHLANAIVREAPVSGARWEKIEGEKKKNQLSAGSTARTKFSERKRRLQQLEKELAARLAKNPAPELPLIAWRRFLEDKTVQKSVFELAKRTRDNAAKIAHGLCARIETPPGFPAPEVVIQMKGDFQAGFEKDGGEAAFLHHSVEGVPEKHQRKEREFLTLVKAKPYFEIREMRDMARGRFNLPTFDAVDDVALGLAKAYGADNCDITRPRYDKTGYGRYHIDVRDSETGLWFEWQIGTHSTSQFLQNTEPNKMVRLPEGFPKIHGQTLVDFHTIKYDFLDNVLAHEPPEVKKAIGLDELEELYKAALERTGKLRAGSPLGETFWEKDYELVRLAIERLVTRVWQSEEWRWLVAKHLHKG